MAARTTKLQAVNVMLEIVGETTTNTLSGTLPFEVSLAVDILEEAVRELSQDSFVFNTEEDVVLTPDVSNNIAIPGHYVQIRSRAEEYVIRDNNDSPILYSMRDKTSTFTSDITVDIVYLLEFEDLPEAAKRYCMIRAGRVYADRLVGSKDIRAFSFEAEMEARGKLMNYQHGIDKINMITDSIGMSNILDRRI
jgi:hypothetical protein